MEDVGVLVDEMIAQRLGGTCQERTLLAAASASMRAGHLYLDYPSSPSSIVEEIASPQQSQISSILGRWGNRHYFQKDWATESSLLREFTRLVERSLPPLKWTQSILSGLTQEQSTVLGKVGTGGVTCLSGGPGTGKTHTLGRLATSFLQTYPERRLVLSAPTGKAVAQLKEAVAHSSLNGCYHSSRIEAATLHSLLNIRPDRAPPMHPPFLFADLIIVDEASMIDAPLFLTLLKAIGPDSRLLLVGDPNQLPPINQATVYTDLCDILASHYPHHLAHLSHSLRAQNGNLSSFAQQLRTGHLPDQLPLHSHLDLAACLSRFPTLTRQCDHPQALLSQLKSFRLLSTLRKGPRGTEAINQMIFKTIQSAHQPGYMLPIPILITQNDPALGLYNGETGLLLKRSSTSYCQEGDRLLIETDQGLRQLDAPLLKNFELAYCLSVHKSQGSEYEEVILIIPPGSESFGREILYTGLTRARNKVTFVGSRTTIEHCLTRSSKKRSSIQARLPYFMKKI